MLALTEQPIPPLDELLDELELLDEDDEELLLEELELELELDEELLELLDPDSPTSR